MTLEQLLKAQGFTDEQISKIINGMKENKIYTTSEENIEERYSKLKGQKEDVDEQLKTANDTIEELKKSNTDNETLQATIKEHETTIETLKTESEIKIRNITLDNAIKLALKDNQARYEDLLISKFDREKLSIKEDGTVEGLEEQVKAIKEGYKDLFEQPLGGYTPPNNGESSGGSAGISKDQFAKMGYKEKVEIYNKNPELYRQLNE